MGRKADARTVLFERIRNSPAKFVHVVGVPYAVEAEQDLIDPLKNDHVWITVEAPPFGRLRCAINTLSRLNRDAGFDSRVRVAILSTTWTERPPTSLEEVNGLDYAVIEAQLGLTYELYEHQPLSDLLIERAKSAVRAEVWGELYAGETLGVHQIHCRRASCAVKVDVKGRDGALKLYYAKDNLAEMFFFKFCGQP
jgi:hypothetical protein